jgi:phospholipid/cholesterol/gamma-HCH transport system substrate-binding protein
MTIAISMILFLEPTVGDGKKFLQVRFANIAGINVGTRVTYAGKPVGEVTVITEVYNAREQPTDDTGRVYLYQLTLKVDSKVAVYNTDEIAIRTTGLMGEKSIAILPKAPPKGRVPHLISDQVIYANSVDPLENTFNQMTRVATRVQNAVDNFDDWFDENRDALSAAVKSFDGAMSRAETVLASIDDEHLVPSMRESVDLLSDNLRIVRSSLEDDQLLHKAANLMDNLDQAVASYNIDGAQTLKNLNMITHDIASGTGTLGRLITSEDFYLRVNSLMSKAETLMNDVNHYGILFQYDKSWQRSRTKKANLVKALDSPNEFRTYFEGEVDTIQTSLGRLTELLDRAETTPEREKILQSESFKRDFASLLRQVQALTDSIKLYNEELVAKADCCN